MQSCDIQEVQKSYKHKQPSRRDGSPLIQAYLPNNAHQNFEGLDLGSIIT